MSRIFISCAMLLFANFSYSQSLEDINDMMGKLQYKEAKAAIDKYLSNPKKASDAEAYYYKGRIYNSLSFDSSVAMTDQFSLKADAFEAFKKNQQLDAKDLYLSLESHTSYLNLYYGYYDLGVRSFNKKNYSAAIDAFKKAIEVENFILDKKYEYPQTSLNRLDTSLIVNIATCATQTKNEPLAVEYYQKIVDAGISGPDFKEAYQYIVDYCVKNGNEKGLNDILSKARKVYPNDDYWIDAEIKMVSKKGDKVLLFAKYEDLIKQNPSNFVLPYNYAVELYNSLYGKDATHTGDQAMADKLTAIAKQAIANEEKTEISGTMLICNHLYNMSADLVNNANAIKSTKPEDIKKKNDMKAVANKSMDECIIFSELAIKYFESLASKTEVQKANYKIILGYMADIYSLKKNPVKAAEYQKKNKAADNQ